MITVAWTEGGKSWDIQFADMSAAREFADYLRRVRASEITIDGSPF